MKKIIITISLFLLTISVFTQNVGIGTATPVARLQINHRSNTTVGIQLLDSFASRAGSIRFSTINNPVGIIMSGFYESPFNKGHYLDISSDSAFIATFRGDGNVGIGTISPTARLHVDGKMKIEGSNTVEFGGGVTKELNAGKIGYQTFTPGALDIIGAGTTVATRKVNFFAEGGTTFNGPINVGGSSGTTGQVLTSNGITAPTWQNAAFNNNVRFEVDFNGSSNTLIVPPVTTTTVYNLNPAVVFIGPTGLSVSRSGLYHIEGFYSAEFRLNGAPSYAHLGLTLNIDTRNFLIWDGAEPFERDMSSSIEFIYRKSMRFVNEVYISAPGIIYFILLGNFNLGTALLNSSNHFGKISGYLISD
ncbi:MAG: hypothetical protein ACKVOW_02140 [Chitinophagaceae bacterium]